MLWMNECNELLLKSNIILVFFPTVLFWDKEMRKSLPKEIQNLTVDLSLIM